MKKFTSKIHRIADRGSTSFKLSFYYIGISHCRVTLVAHYKSKDINEPLNEGLHLIDICMEEGYRVAPLTKMELNGRTHEITYYMEDDVDLSIRGAMEYFNGSHSLSYGTFITPLIGNELHSESAISKIGFLEGNIFMDMNSPVPLAFLKGSKYLLETYNVKTANKFLFRLYYKQYLSDLNQILADGSIDDLDISFYDMLVDQYGLQPSTADNLTSYNQPIHQTEVKKFFSILNDMNIVPYYFIRGDEDFLDGEVMDKLITYLKGSVLYSKKKEGPEGSSNFLMFMDAIKRKEGPLKKLLEEATDDQIRMFNSLPTSMAEETLVEDEEVVITTLKDMRFGRIDYIPWDLFRTTEDVVNEYIRKEQLSDVCGFSL